MKGEVNMVSSGRQAIVSLLLLVSTVVSAHAQSAVDKSATSTISGKVTVGGKGVSGVVVGLVTSDQWRSNPKPTRFRSTTDEEGNYRITKVPAGTYDVIPASPAYVATEGRKSLIVGKNETVENIDIALARGGVITGKVTDAEGRPVIEEMIHVSAAKPGPVSYFRSTLTDDRGIYRAYGVPAGSYKVSAGRDVNSNLGSRRPEATHQRTYHPSAVDPAAATVIEVSEGSEATNVDITFGAPARIYSARGLIIDADTSRPVPNLRVGVQMFFQNGTSSMGGVAESGKDGEFKVESLAPGKYAVYSEMPTDSDSHSQAVQFEVTDQDVEGLLIKITKGASVSGVVVVEGTDDPKVRASLSGSRISGHIFGGDVGPSDRSATINPDGSFRITGLAPGRLMLHPHQRERFRLIRIEHDGVPYLRGVDIKEREQVTGLRVVVGYANGGILGVVKIASGSELPPTARLVVGIRRVEDLNPASFSSPLELDVRGQFRYENLIPGTYELAVTVFTSLPPSQRPRIPPTRQTVVVTNGTVADVTITLQIPKPAGNGP